jgi:hypothetical protein
MLNRIKPLPAPGKNTVVVALYFVKQQPLMMIHNNNKLFTLVLGVA